MSWTFRKYDGIELCKHTTTTETFFEQRNPVINSEFFTEIALKYALLLRMRIVY